VAIKYGCTGDSTRGWILAQSSSTQWDSHLLDISKLKHIATIYIFHSHVHQFPGESTGRTLALFSICWVWSRDQEKHTTAPGLNGLSAGDKHICSSGEKRWRSEQSTPTKANRMPLKCIVMPRPILNYICPKIKGISKIR